MCSSSVTAVVFVFYRANFVQINGTRYSKECVIALAADTAGVPTFGFLSDILLTDVDNCLFVCEVLETDQKILQNITIHTESPEKNLYLSLFVNTRIFLIIIH